MTFGVDEDFWRGRRVLLTGHTGFKGGWMSLWLERLGATVRGVALPPDTQPNLFEAARVADGLDSVIADVRDPDAMDAGGAGFRALRGDPHGRPAPGAAILRGTARPSPPT